MIATLFDRPVRNSFKEDIDNPIDDLDMEDEYDRFSKKSHYEHTPKDSYEEEEDDYEDFYDRDWSMD